VSFNEFLSSYMMLYVDAATRAITVRLSPSPWGPFDEPRVLTGIRIYTTTALAYLGFEHAAFQQDKGKKIYVSYCQPEFRMNESLQICFADEAASRVAASVLDAP
jgi:hypothetical protein